MLTNCRYSRQVERILRIAIWLTRDDSVVSTTKREDERLSRKKLGLTLNWSTPWLFCRNDKQNTTRGSCWSLCTSDAYGVGRTFKVERVSWGTWFRSLMPNRWMHRRTSCLAIYVRPLQCLSTTGPNGQRPAEIRPSWITRQRTTYVLLWDLRWTCKRTMYVQPNETPLILNAKGKNSYHSRILPLMHPGWNPKSYIKRRQVANTWFLWLSAVQNAPAPFLL